MYTLQYTFEELLVNDHLIEGCVDVDYAPDGSWSFGDVSIDRVFDVEGNLVEGKAKAVWQLPSVTRALTAQRKSAIQVEVHDAISCLGHEAEAGEARFEFRRGA